MLDLLSDGSTASSQAQDPLLKIHPDAVEAVGQAMEKMRDYDVCSVYKFLESLKQYWNFVEHPCLEAENQCPEDDPDWKSFCEEFCYLKLPNIAVWRSNLKNARELLTQLEEGCDELGITDAKIVLGAGSLWVIILTGSKLDETQKTRLLTICKDFVERKIRHFLPGWIFAKTPEERPYKTVPAGLKKLVHCVKSCVEVEKGLLLTAGEYRKLVQSWLRPDQVQEWQIRVMDRNGNLPDGAW